MLSVERILLCGPVSFVKMSPQSKKNFIAQSLQSSFRLCRETVCASLLQQASAAVNVTGASDQIVTRRTVAASPVRDLHTRTGPLPRADEPAAQGEGFQSCSAQGLHDGTCSDIT